MMVMAGIENRALRRTETVYATLRAAIVTGEIRPNSPLIEVDLAERLVVSRTPVRESLQRLAAAGLIVRRKRGWSVREYTEEEIRQNSEVRIALEGHATYLAAGRATEDELAAIRALHEMRTQIRASDEELRVSTNRNFHDAIILAAKNPRLTNAIYGSGQFYFNRPIARISTDEEMRLGNADHALIVKALLVRDAAAAEIAMRRHIQRTFMVYQRLTETRTGGAPRHDDKVELNDRV
jgi:DNA-binding GntR family transcriptional regulator